MVTAAAAPARVLVIDAHLRSAVAGIRGLGRTGVRPITVGPRHGAAGCWSRYADSRVVLGDPDGFAGALAAVADEHGPLVAYPGSEQGVDGILAAADRSPNLVTPWPAAALPRLRNKPELARLAAGAGVATPDTLVEASAAALVRQPPALPCAIKPVRQDGRISSTRIVRTHNELADVLAQFEEGSAVLVQPLVPGQLVSLGIVLDRAGGVLAAFQQAALRTWPARAGSSAVGISQPLDPRLLTAASTVLRAAGYWGLADVEFLVTPDQATLIDINTRYYGNLALATACGANLPAAWHDAVLGRDAPARPPDYRTGVTYRWVEADVVATLSGGHGRLRCDAPRPRVGPMWASDDPVPAVLMALPAVTERVRVRVRRLARGSR